MNAGVKVSLEMLLTGRLPKSSNSNHLGLVCIDKCDALCEKSPANSHRKSLTVLDKVRTLVPHQEPCKYSPYSLRSFHQNVNTPLIYGFPQLPDQVLDTSTTSGSTAQSSNQRVKERKNYTICLQLNLWNEKNARLRRTLMGSLVLYQ
ncbi:hypothetical protein C5167_034681 [Papaver somniferum]|uniref:Uncharacterized protein n=1 Tax=Papaver somniferum TaxID=3469 RepID=A0A4Y7KDJ0_PAPSO|nr:hypothetical protein C5167_034681 [Papaver somniferum]